MTVIGASVALLRGATLPEGRVADIALADGRVRTVAPPGTLAAEADAVVDMSGFVVLPAPAEPHAHLDKALTWDVIQPPTGDLRAAIESFHDFAAVEDEDGIASRAERALAPMLAAGTTAVRSHVNFFGGDDPLRAFRALARVRERYAGLVDLELVALPSWETPDLLIEQAIELGADLVGGAPHLAPEPLADLARLLDIAERAGRGVDLHMDEDLHTAPTLQQYAERTLGWPTGRTASHCVRLGTLQDAELHPIVEALRRADIGIVGLPITNLYLQGREQPVSTPRGITALRALLDAGVRVAAGADNVRDPFNPMGRSDALETASLLVTAGHLGIAEAVAAVTSGARSVLGMPIAGPVEGAVADLLAVRADSLAHAVAAAPADRIVLKAGRLVSVTRTTTETALTHPADRSELQA